MSERVEPRGCDVRLHLCVRSPCGVLHAARHVHMRALSHLSLSVDQPRVSGRMIPERSLSSPCRERKRLLSGAVSCESLPRPTRHSLGALWGVRRGTPDSDCPWHLVHSLLTPSGPEVDE